MIEQAVLFERVITGPYRPVLTAIENRKGVLDVDTVKGCSSGMSAYPQTGCYGACYAATTARQYGRDFAVSVSRTPAPWSWRHVWRTVRNYPANWYRIGTAGDPCHDWKNTIEVCEMLRSTGKHPVIITKHWQVIDDDLLGRLRLLNGVVNTSISALDTGAELRHRLRQIERIREAGLKSVARVVTCNFGNSAWARERRAIQEKLLQLEPCIDNPLRIPATDRRVIDGHLIVSRIAEAVGGGKSVSLHRPDVYLGKCVGCSDQCGAHNEND